MIIFLFNDNTFSNFRYDRLAYFLVCFIFRNIWFFFNLTLSLFTFNCILSWRPRYIDEHFIVSKIYAYLRSKVTYWNWRITINMRLDSRIATTLVEGEIIRIVLIVLRRNIVVIIMNDNLWLISILIKAWLSSTNDFCLRI